MKCPHCLKDINIGKLIGSVKSEKKAVSSRLNGSKGRRSKMVRMIERSLENHNPSQIFMKCQVAHCNNGGIQVLVQGLKAWLCKDHGGHSSTSGIP